MVIKNEKKKKRKNLGKIEEEEEIKLFSFQDLFTFLSLHFLHS